MTGPKSLKNLERTTGSVRGQGSNADKDGTITLTLPLIRSLGTNKKREDCLPFIEHTEIDGRTYPGTFSVGKTSSS